MRYVKMLGLLAVAVAALMTFAGSAFGAIATSPTGTAYTNTLKLTSEGALSFHMTGTVTCQKSTIEGKVESHGKNASGITNSASGKVSGLTFTECGTDHFTVKQTGNLFVTSAGTLFSTGTELSITKTASPVGHITCVFTTNNTHIGKLTDSHETGGHATLDLLNSQIPRTGGSFLCGSFAEWTGSYTVTTPTRLYID
jgi:hypothetical protein